jgi:dTDP-4-amino-4,6-dideoxygalactose transaminase
VNYAGAWPVFIDAEPEYWQMDGRRVAEFLEHSCEWQGGELRSRATGRRVRVPLPVHILGHPVDRTARTTGRRSGARWMPRAPRTAR